MESALLILICALVCGFVMWALGLVKSVKQQMEEMLKKPNDVYGNISFGMKLFDEEKYDDAIRFFNNINRNIDNEANFMADYYSGMILFKKNDDINLKERLLSIAHNDSLESIEKNKDLKGCLAASLKVLGYLFFIEGNYELAFKYKETSKKIEPELEFDLPRPRFDEYENL